MVLKVRRMFTSGGSHVCKRAGSGGSSCQPFVRAVHLGFVLFFPPLWSFKKRRGAVMTSFNRLTSLTRVFSSLGGRLCVEFLSFAAPPWKLCLMELKRLASLDSPITSFPKLSTALTELFILPFRELKTTPCYPPSIKYNSLILLILQVSWCWTYK